MGSLEGLREALEVDKALSLGQCERYWGVGLERLRAVGLDLVRVEIGLTKHQQPKPLVFVCSSRAVAKLHPNQLRHLAGVAEMRQLLGARLDAWHSEAERERALLYPDAVWQTPSGKVAIEFDAGSYNPNQLEQKCWTYARNFSGQIWGTPSLQRAGRLRYRLRQVTNAQVVALEWT